MGLFGSIGNFFKNALTPPGTSEANRDRARKAKPQELAGGYLRDLDPLIQSQIGFANRIEPMRQGAIDHLMWAGTPNGVQATVDQARRGFTGAELANLPYLRQALTRGGAGIGAMQGAEVAALNRGVTQGNDLAAWFATPEGKQALARMQLAASAYGIPALGDFSNLSSVVYGRPAPAVGPSPLAGVANLGGLLLSQPARAATAPLMLGGGYSPVGGVAM